MKDSTRDEERFRFVRALGHDLRTPLGTILGYAAMIEECVADGDPPEEIIDQARRIEKSGRHMLHILDGIQALVRIETGRWDLAPQVLMAEDLARSCVMQTADLAREYGVAVVTEVADGLPGFRVDAEAAARMVLELLDNAIRHSPENGTVRLELSRNGEDAVLSVHDGGCGMTPEEAAVATMPFEKGKTSKARGGGSGLGLAIAAGLAELHNGRLEIESVPGSGTTVSLVFPGCF